MHFEYEIAADDYVAGQLLYHKHTPSRKHTEGVVAQGLAGLFFLVVAWNERRISWSVVLISAFGVWWIYGALASLFVARHFRRAYKKSELAGRKFQADVDADAIEVRDDLFSWRVRWPGVRLKAENDQMFMLYAAGTIFMFGKKYLTEAQQLELRRLCGFKFLR